MHFVKHLSTSIIHFNNTISEGGGGGGGGGQKVPRERGLSPPLNETLLGISTHAIFMLTMVDDGGYIHPQEHTLESIIWNHS